MYIQVATAQGTEQPQNDRKVENTFLMELRTKKSLKKEKTWRTKPEYPSKVVQKNFMSSDLCQFLCSMEVYTYP